MACRGIRGHGGDFGRKTNGTRGLANTKRVYRGPQGEERRNSRESSGLKGHLRVPALCLFDFATASSAAKHTPARDLRSNSLLAARSSFSLYQVSRNETTTSLISACRNARFVRTFNLYDTRMIECPHPRPVRAHIFLVDKVRRCVCDVN